MAQQDTSKLDNTNIEEKKADCVAILRELKRVVVAFSAGVDSTLLLALAAATLGPENVLAAIGVSPSLPKRELSEAKDLARRLKVELIEISTSELEDPRYSSNPAERCYFCKQDLFRRVAKTARSRGFEVILSGANADDTGDFRPGLQAGRELGIRNPLMEAGLTKAEVRELSRRMGLPTWDKPAMACLASRVPYGQPITADRLGRIEQAEQAIRDLGFRQVRVRDHDVVARIEVAEADLPRLLELRQQVAAMLKKCGYTYITLDLQGFRSGSSNEILPQEREK
jgi:pyridinium-3,5-biscarboxylic acid mononucleotide sulfurtransferase